jgi:hypothetical protein
MSVAMSVSKETKAARRNWEGVVRRIETAALDRPWRPQPDLCRVRSSGCCPISCVHPTAGGRPRPCSAANQAVGHRRRDAVEGGNNL